MYVDRNGVQYATDSSGHPLTRGVRPQRTHKPMVDTGERLTFRTVDNGPTARPRRSEHAFCTMCGARVLGAGVHSPKAKKQEAQRTGNKSRQRQMARLTAAANKSERRTPDTQKRTVRVGSKAAKKRATAYKRGSSGLADESGRLALQKKTARKKRRTSYAMAAGSTRLSVRKSTGGKARASR